MVAGNGFAQQEDYSGLTPFWAIAETVAAGQEPSASAWAALFATPGYRTLQERDNADRFLQRLLPLALSPEHAAEAEEMIGQQPITGMFIAHLRAAYEQREELALFRAELEQRPLLLEAIGTAQQWLPAGSTARFGAPPLSFVIYQPDPRGYDRIVMDLLLAFEQPALFEDLLAHETHHVIRARLQGAWNTGDRPEADLLLALDNLQAEGVADMIDKPATLAVSDWADTSTGSALALLSGRMLDELERVQQRLAAVDEILAGYASDPGAAEELGGRLREELVMGGHPVGYHMAGVIVAAGGRQRMIDNVADPFDFARAYNDAARAHPGQHHVFSNEALQGLALLQELTEQPESPQPGDNVADIPPTAVIPSPEQLAYQRMELVGFVHFTVNTFTDREWGYGDESPEIFAPGALDADQWASIAAEVGMGELILTAKHHDGFALWPSRYTDHSVASSPWRNGEGDVVAELAAAARRHGLEVGLYLSPWDRNHADYGTPAYIDYYRDQLTELLTDYGEITEVWFDGANGGDGYYGGANEERRIDRATYYAWPATWALVKSLQPGTLIFSDAGPDIRWTGNERGFAGETNWSTIDAEGIVVGGADADYLNRGDPDGAQWVVPLCNTSIRPGWFYHEAENDRLKSPQELVDVYYRSVGRNCVLLLNVPPDTRGLWHDNDVAVLREFRRILDQTFATDLAAGRPVTVVDSGGGPARVGVNPDRNGGQRAGHPKFAPGNLVDGDPETYWATDDGVTTATLDIDLGAPTRFDRILLQEPVRFGQRIAAFGVEARSDGAWREIARATTIGYKRLLRIEAVIADRVRIVIGESVASPLALSRVALFEASPAEQRN